MKIGLRFPKYDMCIGSIDLLHIKGSESITRLHFLTPLKPSEHLIPEMDTALSVKKDMDCRD